MRVDDEPFVAPKTIEEDDAPEEPAAPAPAILTFIPAKLRKKTLSLHIDNSSES